MVMTTRSYAQAQARKRRTAFLKVNWWFLPLTAMFTIGMSWMVAGALRISGASQLLVGFGAGSAAAATVAACWWLLYEVDGGRTWRLGNSAERDTHRTLRWRRGWRAFWSIPFERMDVDHVAIGGRGVLVLETKHTSVEWSLRDRRLIGPFRDPVEQARASAQRIRGLLRSGGVVNQPVAAIVIWGALSWEGEVPVVSVEGVHIVPSHCLVRWMRSVEGEPLTASQVDTAIATLADYKARFRPDW